MRQVIMSDGRRLTVALEGELWQALGEIALWESLSLPDLIREVAAATLGEREIEDALLTYAVHYFAEASGEPMEGPLPTSRIGRLECLRVLRGMATAHGHMAAGHGAGRDDLAEAGALGDLRHALSARMDEVLRELRAGAANDDLAGTSPWRPVPVMGK